MQENRYTVELIEDGFVVVDSTDGRQVLAFAGEPGSFNGAYHSRARARAAAAELDAAAAAWLAGEQERRWAARTIREARRSIHYGFVSGAANCASCGCFKSSHAAVCGRCGDDPVTYRGDRAEHNRAYGRVA